MDTQLQRYLEEHNGEREKIKISRNRGEKKKRGVQRGLVLD